MFEFGFVIACFIACSSCWVLVQTCLTRQHFSVLLKALVCALSSPKFKSHPNTATPSDPDHIGPVTTSLKSTCQANDVTKADGYTAYSAFVLKRGQFLLKRGACSPPKPLLFTQTSILNTNPHHHNKTTISWEREGQTTHDLFSKPSGIEAVRAQLQ